MDRHAYHTFQILEHVENTPLLTNRRAATKLGVSVKLAHALLTLLVQKGMLDIRKHHSRRWDYFLTPKGIAEKARLTYEFMDFTMQFYRDARRRSSEVLAQAVIHCCLAPKSNAVINAYERAATDVRAGLTGPAGPSATKNAAQPARGCSRDRAVFQFS